MSLFGHWPNQAPGRHGLLRPPGAFDGRILSSAAGGGEPHNESNERGFQPAFPDEGWILHVMRNPPVWTGQGVNLVIKGLLAVNAAEKPSQPMLPNQGKLQLPRQSRR